MFRVDREKIKDEIESMFIESYALDPNGIASSLSWNSNNSDSLNNIATDYNMHRLIEERIKVDPVLQAIIFAVENRIYNTQQQVIKGLQEFVDQLYGEDDFEKDIGLRP